MMFEEYVNDSVIYHVMRHKDGGHPSCIEHDVGCEG